jgi:hypothetical protein
LLVLLAGVGGIAYVGFRTAQGLKASIEDPAARATEVQKILGYEDLPEGYQPAIGLSIPFLFNFAMLADQAPDAEGEFRESVERAFFYVRLSGWIARDNDLRDIFEGQGDPARALEEWRDSGVQVRGSESIGEGTITVAGRDIRYATMRGEMRIDNSRHEGILALIVVKCGEGKRDGLGGWMLPDPSPDEPIETVELSNTPADPQALAGFLSRFELCR